MSSLTLVNLLLVVILLAVNCSAATDAGASDVHALLFSTCSTDTAAEPFATDLGELMSLLIREAPAIGFGLGSVGKAHGLAMCRADIKSSICMACIHAANGHLLRRCPSKKEATTWLDHCLVRYSDTQFFGEISDGKKFLAMSNGNSSKASVLDSKVEEIMETLVSRAYLTPLLFATAEVEVEGEGGLFGLVQCTRDLSGGDCKRCLASAMEELPRCCRGKKGGRVVGKNCNLRYEMYPFYDSS
ncbi:hypothetical protein HPP92_018387 [Vanilla planifolia]|uniref:Gnk2-homologous domain-containing protein n=1 Tax=Vanilla planifolia TaxID=51239 RepID=A0A835UM77_VANPL|nr:hypothetical protein HPP92_018387 [Vanilla planifolia]